MGSISRGTQIWAKTMPKTKAPCKNCPKRSLGCHGRCKEYQDYWSDMEQIRQKRKKQIEGDYFPGSQKKL